MLVSGISTAPVDKAIPKVPKALLRYFAQLNQGSHKGSEERSKGRLMHSAGRLGSMLRILISPFMASLSTRILIESSSISACTTVPRGISRMRL